MVDRRSFSRGYLVIIGLAAALISLALSTKGLVVTASGRLTPNDALWQDGANGAVWVDDTGQATDPNTVVQAAGAPVPRIVVALWLLTSGDWKYYLPQAPGASSLLQVPSPASLIVIMSSGAPSPAPPPSPPTAFSFGDGQRVVPADIPPGTYRTRQGSAGCYWARLSGFGGTLDEILANDFTDSTAIVAIAASDRGFSATRCGTWTKIN